MAQTIVGLYDNLNDAQAAVRELTQNGFRREDISLIANDVEGNFQQYNASGDVDTGAGGAAAGATGGGLVGGLAGLLLGLGALAIPGVGPVIAAGPLAAALAGAGIGAATGGLLGALTDLGIPDEEANYFAEGVRRGGVLLTINADANRIDQAVEIMNRHGAVDLNNRVSTWRQSGWNNFDTNAQPYDVTTLNTERSNYANTSTTTTQRTASTTPREVEGEVRVPIVEENVNIGKQVVEQGGVRIRTYMAERPVEEQVTLREERVVVDRRPVDRAVTDADISNFEEGTIELTERAERAVVNKEARVVEEVTIGKEVTERTETVRATERYTDVEVEELQPSSTSTTTNAFETYDQGFRTHFTSNYGSSGGNYDQYMPAYRYGYNLAGNDRYRGRNWSEIETDVRRSWEERNPNTWDRVSGAIRHAWESVTR